MSTTERWLPVPGWPDYIASTHGRIASQKYQRPWRHLRPFINQSGYPAVDLCDNDRRMVRTVHLIVAETFLGPRPPEMETRHLNGDKTDPRLSNLSYGTRSQNVLDQVTHGVHRNASKTSCRNGHPYSDENTRHDANGSRKCKICRRETQRRAKIRRAFRAAGIAAAA